MKQWKADLCYLLDMPTGVQTRFSPNKVLMPDTYCITSFYIINMLAVTVFANPKRLFLKDDMRLCLVDLKYI